MITNYLILFIYVYLFPLKSSTRKWLYLFCSPLIFLLPRQCLAPNRYSIITCQRNESINFFLNKMILLNSSTWLEVFSKQNKKTPGIKKSVRHTNIKGIHSPGQLAQLVGASFPYAKAADWGTYKRQPMNA